MKLSELQEWIISDQGFKQKFELLARYSAAKSLEIELVDSELSNFSPEWQRLLFSASILAKSDDPSVAEQALMVAHAGLLYSKSALITDASATLLTQLANERAISLAQRRQILNVGLEKRLGIVERMLVARRQLSQSVFLNSGEIINANIFQRQLWSDLERALWVSASAPTASGKTYLVSRWLLDEYSSKKNILSIVIAPTRALVSEIERNLLELAPIHQLTNLRVASLPLAELGDRKKPTILVFTQERLHIFLNSVADNIKIDIAIVDEAQKLGDGLRGVILQDAIERIERTNKEAKFIFLSPLSQNPEVLLSDAPSNANTAVVPSNTPTVTQNIITAKQKPKNPQQWELYLAGKAGESPLGAVALHAKPDTQIKRLSYLAIAVGRNQTGTLIYANGAAEAEKIAWQIYDALSVDSNDKEINPELKALSDFARDTIHPQFQLVALLKGGVAFHYGNMPTLLRTEIERLFREGVIRFLVCTSTLIEGVNLACRTILVRGPRKGNGKPMQGHDFWNLAGRAGRWGQDFHGNIICIDVNNKTLWPNGTPKKELYPIKRKTESVVSEGRRILDYISKRKNLSTIELDQELEQVLTYLLSWYLREGSLEDCTVVSKLEEKYAEEIKAAVANLAREINLPRYLVSRHPGVSAVALQNLLNYFRSGVEDPEELIPSIPSSDDAYNTFTSIFKRINKHLNNAFTPEGAIPIFVIVTLEWMKGLPLGLIISRKIAYYNRHGRPFVLAKVIRDTMREVEEIARFRAPKFLAAYLDVLKIYLQEVGKSELYPEELKFDLFLEFGVATKTLLSLIGLGLSRTSAIAINDYLSDDNLDEKQVFDRLLSREWETLEISAIIRKEIELTINSRSSTFN